MKSDPIDVLYRQQYLQRQQLLHETASNRYSFSMWIYSFDVVQSFLEVKVELLTKRKVAYNFSPRSTTLIGTKLLFDEEPHVVIIDQELASWTLCL